MIIQSFLDTDLYKLTMGQLVLGCFPDVNVTYKFTNRGKQRFNQEFLDGLNNAIHEMADKVVLAQDELAYLEKLPFFKRWYIDYLRNYRFNPAELKISLDSENNLVIDIAGRWHSTIYWEVPLMAMISEVYFTTVDKEWTGEGQRELARGKIRRLLDAGCTVTDMGSRRRRASWLHRLVLEEMKSEADGLPLFGTSNVMLAKELCLNCVGTMAHEFIMGISALKSLRYANREALRLWNSFYDGFLGIALPDTFGTKAFLADFDMNLAKQFDGVRHDSGDADIFAEKIIEHYKGLGIDPTSKKIIFSDGLNTDEAIRLQKQFGNRIKVAFGIGTHFTNDFKDSKALNMVIKLSTVDEFPVVKLSDNPGKATGDKDAVAVARWMHERVAINQQ